MDNHIAVQEERPDAQGRTLALCYVRTTNAFREMPATCPWCVAKAQQLEEARQGRRVRLRQ